MALDAASNVHALAGGADGVDGAEETAGAIMAPDILARAARLRLDAKGSRGRNDAHNFPEAPEDHVITGPTRANGNDFRAILVPPPSLPSP